MAEILAIPQDEWDALVALHRNITVNVGATQTSIQALMPQEIHVLIPKQAIIALLGTNGALSVPSVPLPPSIRQLTQPILTQTSTQINGTTGTFEVINAPGAVLQYEHTLYRGDIAVASSGTTPLSFLPYTKVAADDNVEFYLTSFAYFDLNGYVLSAYDTAVITATLAPVTAVPANTVAPVASGATTQGATLSVTTGTWSGSPTSYAYQWVWDNGVGVAGTAIPNAISSTYVTTAADVGKTIRCNVRASNAGGSSATFAPSNVLAAITAVSSGGNTTDIATFGALDAAGGSRWSYRPNNVYTPLTGVSLKSGSPSAGAYVAGIVNGKLGFTGGGRGAPDGAIYLCTYAGGTVEVTISRQADSYALRDMLDFSDLRVYASLNPTTRIIPIYFRHELIASVGRKSQATLKDARAIAVAGTTPGLVMEGNLVTLTSAFVGTFSDYYLNETLYVRGYNGTIKDLLIERLPGGPDMREAIRVYYTNGNVINLEDSSFIHPDMEPCFGSGTVRQENGIGTDGLQCVVPVHIQRIFQTASSADPIKLSGGRTNDVQLVKHSFWGPSALIKGRFLDVYSNTRGYILNEYVKNEDDPALGIQSDNAGIFRAKGVVPAGAKPNFGTRTSNTYWEWGDPHGDGYSCARSAGGVLVEDCLFDGPPVLFPGQDAMINNNPRMNRDTGTINPHKAIVTQGCHFPRPRNGRSNFPVSMSRPTEHPSGTTLVYATARASAHVFQNNWVGCQGTRSSATRYTTLGWYLYGGTAPPNCAFILNRDADLGERIPDSDARQTVAVPVVTLATPTTASSTTAAATVAVDVPGGIDTWVVTTSVTKPTELQVRTGQDHTGASVGTGKTGSVSVPTTTPVAISASGLTPGVAVYFHHVYEDATGTRSIVTTSASVTPAAIAAGTMTFIGGKTENPTGSAGNKTISLTDLNGGIATAPVTGDLVIVAAETGSSTSRSITMASAGWSTAMAHTFSNDANDSNFAVFYKLMGATPDTSFDIFLSSVSTEQKAVAVHVWRGVDQTTPMDVTPVPTNELNGMAPNPGAITPITSGAMIIVAGGGAYKDTVPQPLSASYLSNVQQTSTAHATSACSALLMGSVPWAGGAYDPAAFTSARVDVADSWGACTMALRPA